MRVQLPGVSARRRLPALLATSALAVGVVLSASVPAHAEPTTSQKITATEGALDDLNLQVDMAVEQYNEVQLKLADVEKDVDAQKAALAEAQEKVAALQITMGQLAAAAYRSGGTSEINLFFTADTSNFLARAGTIDSLSRNQQGTVDKLAVAQRSMAGEKAKADKAASAAKALAQTLDSQKTQIEGQVRQTQTMLSQLEQQKQQEDAAAADAQAKATAAAQAKASAAQAAAAQASAVRAQAAAAQAAAARAQSAAAQAAATAAAPPTASRSLPTRRTVTAPSTSVPAPAPAAPAPAATSSADVPTSDRAGTAVAWAKKKLGSPYKWAAAGPDRFDCSGLTSYVWAKAGVSLPHSSRAQFDCVPHVSQSELQPGDLTFYGSPIHHVGIYIGGGQMISAPHSGDVVKVQDAIRSDYVGAVRPG